MNDDWKNQLQKKLTQEFGASQGSALYEKYAEAFHASYWEDHSTNTALNDIGHLEKLSADTTLAIDFYISLQHKEYPLHIRLYQYQRSIPLSDTLPMLENLDLRTYDERLYEVTLSPVLSLWISDFNVKYNQEQAFDLTAIKTLFEDAFIQTYLGHSENDGFNKLVLSAALPWREIAILRTYAKYLRQIGFHFTQAYIEHALLKNSAITKALVALFIAKFDPKQKAAAKAIEALEQTITQSLEAVTSLDEDRIIRQLFLLIKASLRTNYYQKNAGGLAKPYLAIKLQSNDIPDLPLPHPLYEIFIYSTRFEGIHLRCAKVARGGIRWSDRREDFRTEILGLMKAQKVKNAIIVPSGAKGGFVLKRDTSRTEVVDCYKLFISGLLDLTDNYKGKSIVKPPQVVCYDDDDPYLVVAADKGTASFSDLANSISAEYQFWLGDAFASGGSVGYDHKKMGITARGAWESIKRHFLTLGINTQNTDVTVIGIGDMSGDVFGNGMIYSPHIKLVGAFDHRHIFLDPSPDPAISFAERTRLFNLPTSSWEDYNPALISAGGGVFKRSSKSISLSAEIKKVLDVTVNAMTPNELIRALLKAPVDLLYNGGIGTYVKSSTESHADVGDKTNEFCRVNGGDLRCRVVGEGGNLGFTQLGRVEFALTGGLINTDFIDNSAGVDCSDHEVNIKILLDPEVARGKLTVKQRDQLLEKMTAAVAELVLRDNYLQALVMSFSAQNSARYLTLYQEYIRELEQKGDINRQVEFLPDDKKIAERKTAGLGLTSPELAVLLAYSKIHIKNEILKSNLDEDDYLSNIVETAFPALLKKSYLGPMLEHRLRKEIIATQLSNRIVNEMGITFVYRMQIETGASISDIIRAQATASAVFGVSELRTLIDSLNYKVAIHVQYELLHHLRHLLNLATRWFLHNKSLQNNMGTVIDKFSKQVNQLEDKIPALMSGNTKQYLHSLSEQFEAAGLSRELAQKIATYRAMYTSLNVTETSMHNRFELFKTAEVYFAVGELFNLVWFRDQIAGDTRDGHWNTIARLALRDELDILQRRLTEVILPVNEKRTQCTSAD